MRISGFVVLRQCMLDGWLSVMIGMKVEVPLPRLESPTDELVYWISSVVKVAGYKVKLRYEGCGADNSLDYWSSLVSPEVHHVGWCAAHHKKLLPPASLVSKHVDWRDYLMKRITGARTLPADFYNQGMILEVVDKVCIAAMKVARIIDTVDCRLHLQYEGGGLSPESNDFWCHKDSCLIHPVGWSAAIGHRLHASSDYIQSATEKSASGRYHADDCSPDLFSKKYPKVLCQNSFLPAPTADHSSIPSTTSSSDTVPSSGGFTVGLKLEAIDPLNLATICVATVMKVLKDGFLMIGIDGCMDVKHGNDWFCYHSASPCILPAGFCDINSIKLTPPKGYLGQFSWRHYLKTTNSRAAPVNLFNTTIPEHGFKEGLKLEAVDLMDPKLVCVATVDQVIGRLIKLHFDGWEDTFDQWLDCESPDIYPVGWCEVMKYSLEGPKQHTHEAKSVLGKGR